MKKRIGCLTRSGLISALATLVVMTGFFMAQGYELFSPGELNNQVGKSIGGVVSHAEIGGECSLCHTAPWDKTNMADQCVKCHVNIANQRDDQNSLHGVILRNNPKFGCRSCHQEHMGPLAPLTVIISINFPHDNFGFSLNKHKLDWDGKNLACKDCHQSDFYHFDKGICATCHGQNDMQSIQKHILDFGSDCLACHDGLETYGRAFNHDDLIFKLSGKHAETLCIECHFNARTKLDLQNTSQDCFACHLADDAHTGRFGITCSDCHTSAGWEPAKFDHNLSYFKLEGEHINVECEKCHVDDEYMGTPQDCVSCHSEDDEHKGALGTDCGLCHSAKGWKPSTFDHALSTYPLYGLHLPVPCENCHINKVFVGTPTECNACHAKNDKHNGLFGPNCIACHNTGGWLPSTFNHALNLFPLTGAHVNLACTRCHSNFNFQSASPACISCHGEPVYHAGVFGTDCAKCHSTSNWSASYNGSHPIIDEENGINHEGASCKDCHTQNLSSATCLKCHDSNNPED